MSYDDDEYRPVWPSGLWSTIQGGAHSPSWPNRLIIIIIIIIIILRGETTKDDNRAMTEGYVKSYVVDVNASYTLQKRAPTSPVGQTDLLSSSASSYNRTQLSVSATDIGAIYMLHPQGSPHLWGFVRTMSYFACRSGVING